jgi:hypothetical protein
MKCPHCDYIVDHLEGDGARLVPKIGDYGICDHCHGIVIFDINMELRGATDQEIADAGLQKRVVN